MGALEDLLKQISPKDNEQSQDVLVEPTDYGNGVLYFDCIREQFAKSLSAWIGAHKNAIVVAVAPNLVDGANSNSTIRGYIVVVYYTKVVVYQSKNK